jgi:hypothetical protein
MTHKDVIKVLEGLVHRRFSLESLEVMLQNELYLDKHLGLVDVTADKDECDTSDHNLMVNLDAHGIFCDIDIYFLPLRKTSEFGDTILVTEVGYEFDDRD